MKSPNVVDPLRVLVELERNKIAMRPVGSSVKQRSTSAHPRLVSERKGIVSGAKQIMGQKAVIKRRPVSATLAELNAHQQTGDMLLAGFAFGGKGNIILNVKPDERDEEKSDAAKKKAGKIVKVENPSALLKEKKDKKDGDKGKAQTHMRKHTTQMSTLRSIYANTALGTRPTPPSTRPRSAFDVKSSHQIPPGNLASNGRHTNAVVRPAAAPLVKVSALSTAATAPAQEQPPSIHEASQEDGGLRRSKVLSDLIYRFKNAPVIPQQDLGEDGDHAAASDGKEKLQKRVRPASAGRIRSASDLGTHLALQGVSASVACSADMVREWRRSVHESRQTLSIQPDCDEACKKPLEGGSPLRGSFDDGIVGLKCGAELKPDSATLELWKKEREDAMVSSQSSTTPRSDESSAVNRIRKRLGIEGAEPMGPQGVKQRESYTQRIRKTLTTAVELAHDCEPLSTHSPCECDDKESAETDRHGDVDGDGDGFGFVDEDANDVPLLQPAPTSRKQHGSAHADTRLSLQNAKSTSSADGDEDAHRAAAKRDDATAEPSPRLQDGRRHDRGGIARSHGPEGAGAAAMLPRSPSACADHVRMQSPVRLCRSPCCVLRVACCVLLARTLVSHCEQCRGMCMNMSVLFLWRAMHLSMWCMPTTRVAIHAKAST